MSEANAARSPGSPLIYRTGLAAALDARRTLLRKARRRALGVAPLTADSPFLDAARAASYLSRSRRLAAPLGPDAGGPAAYSAEDAVAGKPDEARMAVPFVISTLRRDRHGDAVVPRGCLGTVQDYLNNPQVFFAHKSEDKPIAHARDPRTGKVELTVEDDRILSTAFFHDKTEEARDVFALVAAGYLRSASIGFLPLLGELIQPAADEPVDAEGNVDFDLGGIVFKEWSLLEWSVVAVPANPDALRAHLHTPKGRGLGDTVRKTLLRTVPARGRAVLGWEPGRGPAKAKDVDPEGLRLKPASYEYKIASDFIGQPVKKLHRSFATVPNPKMGSFLSAWRDVVASCKTLGVRNLHGDGSESPPEYEVLKLGPKKTEDFLVTAKVFLESKSGARFVVALSRSWYGLAMTLYASRETKAELLGMVDEAWALAKSKYDFLKGEAFSLTGDFLPKTDDAFDGLFLEPKNEKTLKGTLGQLNAKGLGFANRGTIFMGPPGTGKTLSGRVVRNQARATFIWVAARDFYHAGAFGGLEYAFEMAKELAPSVLFFEDVDNWLGDTSVDYLKSEMDGIARSKGVWTVLTTNHPDRLPDALIDRPGRFHDVLMFDLPSKAVRGKMLRKWLPDLAAADLAFGVEATEGYSGAHVFELAHFAKTLLEQDSGLGLGKAVREAVDKIDEQRALIGRGPRRKGLKGRPAKLIQKYAAGRTLGFVKSLEKSPMPLDDLDKPEGDAPPEAPDEGGEDDAKGVPQAFLFDTAQFPDEEAVRAWLEENGHNADEVHAGEEADEPWAAIQFDASECEPDTAKREDVEEGVQAVYCVKGDGEEEPEEDEPEDASGVDDEDPTYRQAGKSAKGKAAKGKAKASSRLADEPDEEDEDKAGEDPEPPDEHPEEPAKDAVKMPYGAEVLNAVHGHLNAASTYCEEAVTLLEQPKVCKFVTKLTGHLASQCDELRAFGEKLYPDHFQSDGVKPEDEEDDMEGEEDEGMDDEDEESDGVDDEGDDEDDNPKAKKKRPALADEKSLILKPGDLRDLLAAADFLEAAAAESGRKSLKVAGKQHASNLRRVATAHATPAKAPAKRVPKPEAVDAKVIARLMASVRATDKAFYELTGEEF